MIKALLVVSILGAPFFSSCGNGSQVGPESTWVVKDVRIPDSQPLVSRFARHTWLDYRKDTASPWRRIEIVNKSSGLIHREISEAEFESKERWGQKVMILSQSDGKANSDFVSEIARFAESDDWSAYRAFPGPNSNTFTENLIRSVEGISASLDHNAIGKEWGFYVGPTAGGSGLELQTPVVGTAVGIREGVEVSLFGLSAGLSFAPPSLKIPILPPIPRWYGIFDTSISQRFGRLH